MATLNLETPTLEDVLRAGRYYPLGRFMTSLGLSAYFDMQVTGLEHVQHGGKWILANHQRYRDIIEEGYAIHAAGQEGYWIASSYLPRALKYFRAIPVTREKDLQLLPETEQPAARRQAAQQAIASFQIASELVRMGNNVFVKPEGERKPEGFQPSENVLNRLAKLDERRHASTYQTLRITDQGGFRSTVHMEFQPAFTLPERSWKERAAYLNDILCERLG